MTTFARNRLGILVLAGALGAAATPAAKCASGKEPMSPEALQAEVDALKVDKVAWRRIGWKTCLLEGLKESREKHKPLMLWIFIDRPIDDERC